MGLEDLASHSWPGKMRGVEHQFAILMDVVETPSDASDNGSFPVARGRKTWSVIETALPRLFELRSFSLVGIALVPPKG